MKENTLDKLTRERNSFRYIDTDERNFSKSIENVKGTPFTSYQLLQMKKSPRTHTGGKTSSDLLTQMKETLPDQLRMCKKLPQSYWKRVIT